MEYDNEIHTTYVQYLQCNRAARRKGKETKENVVEAAHKSIV